MCKMVGDRHQMSSILIGEDPSQVAQGLNGEVA